MIKSAKSDYLDRLLEKEIKEGRIAGAQIGVYDGENAIYEQEYAYEKDAIYRIYSMTKPVTASLAMILFEQGKFDLLSPVADYLPEFADMKVLTPEGLKPARKQIKVWDLLNMTSGIVYPDEDAPGREMDKQMSQIQARVDTREAFTTREAAAMFAKAPLCSHPGERWRYGLSADVLGALLEAVDGRELSRIYQEELFDPLEMKDTGFWVPKEKAGRLVKLYEQHAEESGVILKEDTKRHLGLGFGAVPPAFVSGGAGLYSTRADYLKFARMQLRKGLSHTGKRLISERTFNLFVKNHLTEAQRKTVDFEQVKGYGYGSFMRIHEDGLLSGSSSGCGEFGWDGWSGPYCSVDIANQRIFLFFTQISAYNNWPLLRQMKAVCNSMERESNF